MYGGMQAQGGAFKHHQAQALEGPSVLFPPIHAYRQLARQALFTIANLALGVKKSESSPKQRMNRKNDGLHVACRRLAVSMYRREQALKDLPGPKHPFLLGMMVDLVCRRDPHRYATELAEQYGPIFKFRLLIFHVSACTEPLSALQLSCA